MATSSDFGVAVVSTGEALGGAGSAGINASDVGVVINAARLDRDTLETRTIQEIRGG